MEGWENTREVGGEKFGMEIRRFELEREKLEEGIIK